MSNIIRSHKAVTTEPRLPPSAQPVSQMLMSPASSVALIVSARHGHRRPCTPDTPSTSTTDASGSKQGFVISFGLTLILYFFAAKKNNWRPCCQLKTTKISWVTNGRITIRYDEQYRAAPTAEQHSPLAHNIGHVVWTYCLMQWKSWKVMPDEVRTKVHTQLSTNYNFKDINDEMLAYINRLFAKRNK
ncbi:hypothetical protein D8674_026491 [Pyrus ussuriensis x Pyrus communis]|uniref:Uncharacterized protein n=1 Tax=Pyrus ussuriensis x Pyrus communis TaxID=2448454 RepID=A0A5N5I9M8_9ROSA|nr:hypothetical protein D8674_026491 [Pyrus ussuriensis x Pyrus communis]